MRLKFLLLFFGTTLLFCNCLNAQVSAFNQVDEAGLRQGYWIIYGKERPDLGVDPELKIEEGNYKNGRKEGMWTKYHADGKTIKLRGNYINNRPSGTYYKYYDNGNLKEQGIFSKNKYSGSVYRYSENGCLQTVQNYGDKLDSIAYYNENGLLDSSVIYNQEPNTLLVHFFSNDQSNALIKSTKRTVIRSSGCTTKPEIKYGSGVEPIIVAKPNKSVHDRIKVENPILKNGAKFNPDGFNKIYNQADEIWLDGEFKESYLLNGKVYIYDQDGILLKVKIYKEGAYFADGQL